MAKKETTKPTTTTTDISTGAFMLGIVLIVLGGIISIALIAFLYSGGADRSIFDESLYNLITDVHIEVQNPIGKLGAWISDMLVTNGIGLTALTVPWMLVVAGLCRLKVNGISFRKHLLYCFLVAIWGALALGFVFSKIASSYYPLMGGTYGYVFSKWLVSSIGNLGTAALLLVSLFIFVVNKVDGLRNKIVGLLQNIHIKLPKLDTSASEGVTLTALTDDDKSKLEKIIEGDSAKGTANDAANDAAKDEDAKDKTASDNDAKETEETVAAKEEHVATPAETSVSNPVAGANGQGANEQGANAGGLSFEVSHAAEEEIAEPVKYAAQEANNNGGKTVAETTLEITNSGGEAVETNIHHGLDELYDPTLDLENYEFPSLDLLNGYDGQEEISQDELEANKDKIVETLKNFQIDIASIRATIGPTVTLYEIVPAPGIRISKVQNLENDIAMSLSAAGIRIIAPIPGKGTIGIEVPNSKPKIVSMRSVLQSKKFQSSTAELPVAIGKTISNETYVFDLAKTPHLLVAGATGQGKSVGLNAIVASILYKKHPSQVKFVLVDPKMVEFSIYKVLEKHYLAKMGSEGDAVITDVDKVKGTLQSLTIEMDSRYELLQHANVRGIKEYNEKFVHRKLNPENGHRYLPYIVVIIDEFADFIMQAGKEVEMPIARIAQKARAVGIHIILATQRPSTNIITGVIKANFPARIAFKVASMIDSRTILDASGAQNLIGRGDLLIHMPSDMAATRVQCAFLDTPEVEKIVEHISLQQGYANAYELPECVVNEKGQVEEAAAVPGKFDAKIKEVARMVVNSQIGSTSNIQRQFEVGFNRAGKLMDQLERLGVVGPADGSKPRTVYVSTESELQTIFANFGIE